MKYQERNMTELQSNGRGKAEGGKNATQTQDSKVETANIEIEIQNVQKVRTVKCELKPASSKCSHAPTCKQLLRYMSKAAS